MTMHLQHGKAAITKFRATLTESARNNGELNKTCYEQCAKSAFSE